MFKCDIKLYMKKQFFIALCLCIGHITVGFAIAWTAVVIPKLQKIDQTPLSHILSDTEASWLCSLIYIGCIGIVAAAYLSNCIGRKATLFISSLITLLSGCLITWPVNLTMMYVARVIMGFSVMSFTSLTMVYLGEVASPDIRGILLTSTGVFSSIGVLLTYSIGPLVYYASLGYMLIGFEMVHLLGFAFVPESPMFYVIRGKEAKARKTLEKLGYRNIEAEMKTMIDFAKQQEVKENKFRDLCTIRSNRKAFLITLTLNVIQQCNGSIVVLLYAMPIFEKAHASTDSSITMIIIGCIVLFGAVMSPVFVDKYGRRVLLILSTSGCCVSMATLGTYFYLAHIKYHSMGSIGWVPLASFVVSLFMYFIGLGIIPNILLGEMFRPNVRSFGTTITMSLGWFTGFLSTTSFGYIVVAIGEYSGFWIFAVVNLIGLFFTVFFVPETKGKSLAEIEEILAK